MSLDARLLDAGRLQVSGIVISGGVRQGLLRYAVLRAKCQNSLGAFQIEHRFPEEAGLVANVDVIGFSRELRRHTRSIGHENCFDNWAVPRIVHGLNTLGVGAYESDNAV